MLEVTDQTFDAQVLQSSLPVLVDYWAPWCAPCRMVAPLLEKLGQELSGSVKLVKLNVDEATQTAQRFRITSLPTLAIFSGGKTISQVEGALPEAQLRAFVEKAIPGLGPTLMTPVMLESALKTGTAVALDLRPASDFARNHLEGSVSAPADPDQLDVWQLPDTVTPEMLVVLVDKSGKISASLARRAGKDRPGKVAVLGGGIFEWELSGRRLTAD